MLSLLFVYYCWLYCFGLLFNVSGTPLSIFKPAKAFISTELYPYFFSFLSRARSFVFDVVAVVRQVLRILREHLVLSGVVLPYTFFPHFLHALLQLTFIKVSLGAGSSSLKVARSPTVIWNIDSAPCTHSAQPLHDLYLTVLFKLVKISW